MDECLYKCWMVIIGLLVGLFIVVVGGMGVVLGLMVVWDGKYLMGDEYMWLLLWLLVGIIGLLLWLWLSGLFLWCGVDGLCYFLVVVWVGLGVGVLVVLGVVVVMLYFIFKYGEIFILGFFGFGLLLLVMVGYLVWLCWVCVVLLLFVLG